MDMETLGYFIYMEEQEKEKENYSRNENDISKENEPPKTGIGVWKKFFPETIPPPYATMKRGIKILRTKEVNSTLIEVKDNSRINNVLIHIYIILWLII